MRYFRCPNPESYYTVDGDVVTYFAPHRPHGVRTEDTAADLELLSRRTPTHERLCCEITEEKARATHARMLAVVEEVAKENARQKALEDSRPLFR